MGEALRIARGAKSIDALADELDVNRNTLGAYERGIRLPEVDFLVAFAAKTGADLGRLLSMRLGAAGAGKEQILKALILTAQGDPDLWRRATVEAGVGEAVSPHSIGADRFSEFELVERKGILGSAGPGAENVVVEPKGALAFRRDWLQSKRMTAGRLIVADIVGDSMERTLFEGDTVVFLEQAELTADDIYLFCLDGRLFVKRLGYRPGGGVEVISDNRERYPPILLTEHEAATQRFEVKGRFFWRGGDRLQ